MAPNSRNNDEQWAEHPLVVGLLAKLLRAFRAREIEVNLDEADVRVLQKLAEDGFVDLANDGFLIEGKTATYLAKSQTPPVTAKGILFLERLPVDKFLDRPGLFRFLGWL